MIVKTYMPAVLIIGLSLTSIFTANGILRKRNAALAAAYVTIEKTFDEYRKQVVEKFGKDTDEELRYKIKTRDDIKAGDKPIKTANIDEPSDYARFFDESCGAWVKDPEMNLSFLKCQQKYANDLLVAHGYLFLNQVYEMLGIPKTKAGQVVGWIYDKKNPQHDNYVDFGIYDLHNERKRDFVNGYERSILLDFNVDGDILSRNPFSM